jgi:hypothetical protein
MRSLIMTLAVMMAGCGGALADGMSQAELAAVKAGLPDPQASVVVKLERGVRVWRPVIDVDLAPQSAAYPAAYPVAVPQYVMPQASESGTNNGYYGYGGGYGLGGGGFAGNANGMGKRDRLNGVGFGGPMKNGKAMGRGQQRMAMAAPQPGRGYEKAVPRVNIIMQRPMRMAAPGRVMGRGPMGGGGYGGVKMAAVKMAPGRIGPARMGPAKMGGAKMGGHRGGHGHR